VATKYRERLNAEIEMIIAMGFAGYFLIVSDFIKWAKNNGIPVGPGRGSGAGSIIAWSLQITDLDPIRFGLLFERFLNPERVSMPDFDIDFCQSRRDEVIDYVQKNIVEPVITIYNDAKAQTNQPPVIFLKSLNVNSSVSRFLNSIDNEGNVIPTGENPDRMSFEVLSTKRADASIEYLKTVLKGYVNWDDSVVIKNTKGTNGDGSSGPDPYKEADNLIKSGKFKDYASVFSSPGFRAKYEQYKYTKFNIEIGVVPIPPRSEEEQPKPSEVKIEKNFKFLFFKEDTDWDFTFKLPSISFKYTSSGKTPSFWTFSENDCELKWWQRIFKKYIVPKGF
jgi:hypothetical protein